MNEAERWRALDWVEQECTQLKAAFPALSRSRFVGGEGPENHPMAFIVGEAPGAVEDMQGRPFVGRSGLVLRQLIRMAGLEPAQCWLTNVVKFRPPKNRTPTVSEIKAFRVQLQREWMAVGAPKLMVAVGGVALQAITGRKQSILRAVGVPQVTNKGVVIYPMIHPRFAFGNEDAQDKLERDWELFGEWRKKNDSS